MELDYDTFAPIFMPDGHAKQWMVTAEDGWLVAYTTERVQGSRSWDGKFVVMAYKPVGKGARGGRAKAESWKRVYARPYATRKAARARAYDLLAIHSPRWFARQGSRWWRS
jgi:hypothetical protein